MKDKELIKEIIIKIKKAEKKAWNLFCKDFIKINNH
jgi:hypothetical protein